MKFVEHITYYIYTHEVWLVVFLAENNIDLAVVILLFLHFECSMQTVHLWTKMLLMLSLWYCCGLQVATILSWILWRTLSIDASSFILWIPHHRPTSTHKGFPTRSSSLPTTKTSTHRSLSTQAPLNPSSNIHFDQHLATSTAMASHPTTSKTPKICISVRHHTNLLEYFISTTSQRHSHTPTITTPHYCCIPNFNISNKEFAKSVFGISKWLE